VLARKNALSIPVIAVHTSTIVPRVAGSSSGVGGEQAAAAGKKSVAIRQLRCPSRLARTRKKKKMTMTTATCLAWGAAVGPPPTRRELLRDTLTRGLQLDIRQEISYLNFFLKM
jgi:hypothetical protein